MIQIAWPFLVSAIFEILCDGEICVYDILDLLTVPIVDEVLLLLLVELVAHLFLHGIPRCHRDEPKG